MAPDLTNTTAPAPRRDNGLAYDALRGKLVLYGGVGAEDYPETWQLELNVAGDDGTWTKMAPPHGADGNPAFAKYAEMVYHTNDQLVYLMGADSESDPVETWTWDGAEWTAVVTSDLEGDGEPTGYIHMNAVYDEGRKRVVLHRSERWELQAASWRLLTNSDPEGDGQPTLDYTLVLGYDRSREEIVGLSRGTNTWRLNVGHVARPGHVFLARLQAAALGSVDDMESITVNWDAGGTGYDNGGAGVDGARLWLLRDGIWQDADEHPGASTARMSWSLSPAEDIKRYISGGQLTFAAAVAPIAANGIGSGYGSVTSAYVEIRLTGTLTP